MSVQSVRPSQHVPFTYTLPTTGTHQNPPAGEILTSFFERHAARRGGIVAGSVVARDLIPAPHPEPSVTPFAALHDTLQFSEIVCEMLRHDAGRIHRIIDLGAGSSVPTIRALLTYPTNQARVDAIDISEAALAVSRENVQRYGLQGRYQFHHGEMLAILSRLEISTGVGIAANPPYLPVPTDTTDPYFQPVDGGEDGTKYLAAILQYPMPVGTYLALEWCSLSNPHRVVELIEAGFEIVYVQANDTHKGLYTEHPTLKSHLLRQHKRGAVALVLNEDDTIGWTFIGTVLRKRE